MLPEEEKDEEEINVGYMFAVGQNQRIGTDTSASEQQKGERFGERERERERERAF
jgi:hypothetical protein